MQKLSRVHNIGGKAWSYAIEALAQPRQIPHVAWSVLAHNAHLGETLKLKRFQSWLQSSNIATVLDVGAHTGEFASAISQILPESTVLSFEPLPDCYQKLKRRMSKHQRFEAFPVALGNRQGEVEFWRSNFSKSSSVLPMADLHKQAFPWTADSTPMKLKIDTLDSCLNGHQLSPDILFKLDVQGYELEVLRGAQETLKLINYVLTETSFQDLYDGQASFGEVYAFMTAAGFEYAGDWEQLKSPIDGSILQVDAFFIRRT